MEGGDNILEAIYEEDNLEDIDDVEMLDVEEGELLEPNPQNEKVLGGGGDVNLVSQGSQNKNHKRRASKKKNKKKKGGTGPNVTDINRFVLDTCRFLKEKKSYMVYAAVGCLGISALSDLVKEVDAIQTCGGQMTADGRRSRTGGGILWRIIKAREPKAYKVIMNKAKEFEKQFKQPNIRQGTKQKKDGGSEGTANAFMNGNAVSLSDGSQLISNVQNQQEQLNTGIKRVPVHDRLRIPVSYDDDLLGQDTKDDAAA
ncbi:hypothetical protein F2P56_012257 [Juglans regia]|uniref:Phosphorylated adapter RNA export protein n=2 Tax=Juglans regia TaxID=51240 RepID=A0A6P9EI57_JUGRE|nr:uncharacterized protein LOC109014535 [Juglans regia]KAF5468076.1 hypothetical protein F2P56_012257 [Juglans regia]